MNKGKAEAFGQYLAEVFIPFSVYDVGNRIGNEL